MISLIKVIKENILKFYNKEVDISFQLSQKDDYHFTSKDLFRIQRELNISSIDVFNNCIKDIKHEYIKEIKFVNNYINVIMMDKFWAIELNKMITDNDYGSVNDSDKYVLLEYLSANPTGPLHVGHGRNAVVGNVLRNILDYNLNNIYSEYYVNDAGKQADLFRLTFHKAIYNYTNTKSDMIYPDKLYDINYATKLFEHHPYRIPVLLKYYKEYAMHLCIDDINRIIDKIDMFIDGKFYESYFTKDEIITKFIEKLIEKDLIYDENSAIFLKTSTNNFDDKDRVLVKSDGSYTYFLADILYHINKFERSYDLADIYTNTYTRFINVWGKDHHGYIPRLKSSLDLLGYDSKKLDVVLIDMVTVEGHKMSKRSGHLVELEYMIDELGSDVTRYILASKKTNLPIDINMDKLKLHNLENPIYYIQYTNARCCSILSKSNIIKHGNFKIFSTNKEIYLSTNINNTEVNLLKKLYEFNYVMSKSYNELEPSYITNYLYQLCMQFNSYYNMDYKILEQDYRVMIVLGIHKIIKTILMRILNISYPESM